MKSLLIIIFGLALAGCSTPQIAVQTASFASQDAQGAAGLAKAAGLVQDQQCWQSYSVLTAALAQQPVVGLLSLVELKRAVQYIMGTPTCFPITTQLFTDLLKISSPQGNILSQILGS